MKISLILELTLGTLLPDLLSNGSLIGLSLYVEGVEEEIGIEKERGFFMVVLAAALEVGIVTRVGFGLGYQKD